MKYSKQENQKKKVLLYTRVSTDEQAVTGFSLANQEELLRRECARRGFEVVDHYRDDGYSATSFERPAFQRLFSYLKQHKKQIDYVFVTKWCRFSRNIENTILMIKEFRHYGTQVITLDDGEVSDNPAALLMQMVNMTLPEVDNRIRSKNTRDGIRRALKEGHYPYGMPPKGYSKDKSHAKTPLLVPNEEAPLVSEAFEIFGTGLYSTEDIRKLYWKKGLKLEKSQFSLLLRNPVYAGKIYVPELGDEDGYLSNGLHQAIVAEKTFWNVQHILNKRLKENVHLVAKEKLREELPLRGHLQCPDCGRNLTGSLSSGNGGRYAYYHCHRGCKMRVSALEVNEKFDDYLKNLCPKPEIAELYLAMMEATFKAKEGDREQQLAKLKNQLTNHEANLLKFDQQRFVTGELEADSYRRLKRHTQDQIEKLKRDMEDLRLTDTAFEKYSRYGISLLTHMDIYFQMAPLDVKRKMLGSIFPGKLILQDGKYRTEGMNPALSLILQKTSELQKEKTGNIVISENVSGDVPMTGLEPALYC